jgi:pimeloyl-ACP methyl ester carboxylesterase
MNAIDKSFMEMESCHAFGRSKNLVGIVKLAAPLPTIRSGRLPGLCAVMLTAGMMHNPGPYRLHVDLSETLARVNISSFRFDLSGIGESLAVGSVNDSVSRAVDESQQAFDFLNDEFGFNDFVLFGLCSGADDAFNVALRDERVRGLVMLDGLGYRTPQFHFRRLIKRQLPFLFQGDKLVAKARKLLGLSDQTESVSPLAPGIDIREFPDRDTAATQLQKIVDRGTEVLAVYTGGVHDYFNHAAQFHEMFPELTDRGRVTVKYYPDWDHVLYLTDDRLALINDVTRWISQRALVKRPCLETVIMASNHRQDTFVEVADGCVC